MNRITYSKPSMEHLPSLIPPVLLGSLLSLTHGGGAEDAGLASRPSGGHTMRHYTARAWQNPPQSWGAPERAEAIPEQLSPPRIMERVADDRKGERGKVSELKGAEGEAEKCRMSNSVSFPGKTPQELKPSIHKHP